MTNESIRQVQEFIKNHPSNDIADIGGIGGIGIEADNYDGYSGFDITKEKLPRKYQTILCMDTFEHLYDPVRAAENIVASLADNGWLFITTVFSWEKHSHPVDTYRYTDDALTWLFRDLQIERVWFSQEEPHPDMQTRVRVSLIGQKVKK